MKRRVVAMFAALVIAGCGGEDGGGAAGPVETFSVPEETPTAVEATPTPLPVDGPGNIQVKIVDGALEVSPTRITRDQGAIALHLENQMTDTVEVLLLEGGRARTYDEVQAALVTGDVVQGGQRQLDRVSVEPGRYELILRPTEPNPATLDRVRLRVR